MDTCSSINANGYVNTLQVPLWPKVRIKMLMLSWFFHPIFLQKMETYSRHSSHFYFLPSSMVYNDYFYSCVDKIKIKQS